MKPVEVRRTLEYAPAPIDNPLKGLVPYAGDVRDRFPHSLEFNYLPFSALVVGPDRYDWTPLERLLNAVAGRGHQAIFRVFLEYPGKTGVVPEFLVRAGVKIVRWKNTNTQPLPPTEVETPDYEDPRLRTALRRFIAALGARYDGDPRVGFITAGLLGTWGEWHTYPRDDLFASPTVQNEVLDAYEKAFRVTPILLRYPTAANAARPFGYHDDSFAWATLDTGKPADSWFFVPALKSAGPRAVDKWRTNPIGGEIRPEAWGQVFDAQPGNAAVQDFARCVKETHVTWLMDSGMFGDTRPDAGRIERAKAAVSRMGYELHVSSVAVRQDAEQRLSIVTEIENRGVAPFYFDWPVEFGLFAVPDGRLVLDARGTGKITGLSPGDRPRVWRDSLAPRGLHEGRYRLALRVANPLPNGKPIRFANRTQDADRPGWLTLAEFGYKSVQIVR